MDERLLNAVKFTSLRRIPHPKGDIFHAMKQSEPDFHGFGEAYFTAIVHGEIKGWKRHARMHLNLVVPVGLVRFYIHDAEQGKTIAYDVGHSNYGRLSIPPRLWVGFQGISDDFNLVLNIASIEHDPDEATNAPIDTFPINSTP